MIYEKSWISVSLIFSIQGYLESLSTFGISHFDRPTDFPTNAWQKSPKQNLVLSVLNLSRTASITEMRTSELASVLINLSRSKLTHLLTSTLTIRLKLKNCRRAQFSRKTNINKSCTRHLIVSVRFANYIFRRFIAFSVVVLKYARSKN